MRAAEGCRTLLRESSSPALPNGMSRGRSPKASLRCYSTPAWAVCPSQPSTRRAMFSLAASRTCGPWRWLARPRAALRLRRWETPVDDHDGDPLGPCLLALLGDTVSQRALEVRYPSVETQDSCRPCLTHIFASPVCCFRQHGHTLPPECGLPRERLPLLLPGRIGVEREDQRTHISAPSPSASRAHQRSPRPGAHLRSAAPAHQRRLRRPTAGRCLPAARRR